VYGYGYEAVGIRVKTTISMTENEKDSINAVESVVFVATAFIVQGSVSQDFY
jgi:hypothetical protein